MNPTVRVQPGGPSWALAMVLLSLWLAGCGGSDDRVPTVADRSSRPQEVAAPSAVAQTRALQMNGRDMLPTASSGASTDQGQRGIERIRKAGGTPVPVYRFFNRFAASHFYTTSETERAAILANPALAHLLFEGPAFQASATPADGFTPVYRFFNGLTGVHFYTISASERDAIIANPLLRHYAFEGIAYYAGLAAADGLMPLYRFYVPSRGFHFYTASAAERNSIRNALSHVYTYEGISSYVVASAVLGELLPHTGASRARCLQSGSSTPVPCDSAGALALNPEQDGHRNGVNPMSYSLLPGFPATSCVKDNVTGLIWEGKEASGTRSGSRWFSHFRDGRPGEALAYVSAVNAARLCGFNDWRLPTVFELFTIVNYGIWDWEHPNGYGTQLDPQWFPNSGIFTASGMVLASDALSPSHRVAALSFSGAFSASLQVADLVLNPDTRFGVRLVRGTPPAQPRFSFATFPYGGDAANNVAVDAWTGLQWRRCLLGQTWNGSTCTGTASEDLNFFQMLVAARQAAGWRMPNARELTSLMEPSRFPAVRHDPVAFPGPLDSERSGVGQFQSSTLVKDWGARIVTFVGEQDTASAPENPGPAVLRLVRSP